MLAGRLGPGQAPYSTGGPLTLSQGENHSMSLHTYESAILQVSENKHSLQKLI